METSRGSSPKFRRVGPRSAAGGEGLFWAQQGGCVRRKGNRQQLSPWPVQSQSAAASCRASCHSRQGSSGKVVQRHANANVALRAPKPRRVESEGKCKSSAAFRARGAPPARRHHCRMLTRGCAPAPGRDHRVVTDRTDARAERGDSLSFAAVTRRWGVLGLVRTSVNPLSET